MPGETDRRLRFIVQTIVATAERVEAEARTTLATDEGWSSGATATVSAFLMALAVATISPVPEGNTPAGEVPPAVLANSVERFRRWQRDGA